MGLMKFYYRHKKVTAYLLGLLLLAGFYHLTQGYRGSGDVSNKTSSLGTMDSSLMNCEINWLPNEDFYLGKKDTTTVLAFIKEGKKGNLPAIANLFAYPIERPYPLSPIKDSAEFVQYGKIIFNDSIRQVLTETTIEDWYQWGWRGFVLHDYFAESGCDDGKMIRIYYESEREKKLREQYIKEEIKSLHPSLQEDIDVPIGTYLSADLQWIGRLDLLKSGIRRFSMYKQGSDLSALPYFTETESSYQHTGRSERYSEFENDSLRVILYLNSYYSSYLEVWKIREESNICPATWRNLIKNSIPKNQQLLISYNSKNDQTNRNLTVLMDSLYEYVNEDSLPSSKIENDIKWMNKYRNQLCSYYNTNKLGPETISPYAKAEAVIEASRKLWELVSDDFTNADMILNNYVEYKRLLFLQYNEYTQLLELCKTDEQKGLLKNEFEAWLELETLIYKIYSNYVYLNWWGGSIIGPKGSKGPTQILESHVLLYRNDRGILTRDFYEDNGVFIECARDLLLNCCHLALKEYIYEDGIIEEEGYKQLTTTVKQSLSILPKTLDNWIKVRKLWTDNVCTDGSRSILRRNTSEVIIRLSNIISSIG